MFQTLVSRNDDIRRLVEKGYAVAFDSNCLIVRDTPYLDSEGQLRVGAMVAKLVFVDRERVLQDDHQIYFAGGVPHGLDGRLVPNLGGGPATITLSEACSDVVVQRSFSNKPRKTGKFADLFEKVESYVGIICGPAMEKHGANPLTFRLSQDAKTDSVFKYADTLTSRAEIADLSARFKDDVVAIIGLGGTGAYVLDFLVRTPVREIRAFDPDSFYVHNAFRSPGCLQEAELGRPKAEVYQARHETFRHGVKCLPRYVDEMAEEAFDGVTFAFVCVDKGSSRSGIFDLLLRKRIPFIDVGMGLNRKRGPLNGMLRTTYYSNDFGETARQLGLAEMSDNPNELYRANVQIGELNALNACIAVIKYKQLRGFYFEMKPEFHLLFEVGDLRVVGESEHAPTQAVESP